MTSSAAAAAAAAQVAGGGGCGEGDAAAAARGESCSLGGRLRLSLFGGFLTWVWLGLCCSLLLAGGGGTEDGMYTELWNLCAGPLVTVPRVGDKVYYFPQGHIEQVSCPIRLSY